jgi:hypothetical protein
MVIHGVSDLLLAARVTLGGLHGDVPEEELNLFEFAASNVVEPGARPPEIVGATLSMPTVFAKFLTTYQTTFSVSPSPQTAPLC